MPLRIELRNERGEVVAKLADPAGGSFDAAGDFDRLLFDDDSTAGADGRTPFKVLRYVDAYGDTIFNQVQMQDLLHDIELVGSRESLTPVERRGLDRLRVMAKRCQMQTHLYVWFIGD